MLRRFKSWSQGRFFGPTLLLISSLLFVVSYSSTKYLTPFLSIQELMFLRFFLAPFVLFPLIYTKVLTFKVVSWPSIFIRTFVGMLSMVFYFFALKHGDPGRTSLIFQTSIIWVYVFDGFFYGEYPSFQTKLMIPVALFGLWCVIQPHGMFGVHLADLLALIASLFNAGVYIVVNHLRKSHNSVSIVAANQTLSSVIILGICFWTLPVGYFPSLTPFQTEIAILLAITGTVGNFFMTAGFKYTSATVGSNMTLTIVPVMYIFGAIFFGESLNVLSWFGVGVVMSSLLVISKYQ